MCGIKGNDKAGCGAMGRRAGKGGSEARPTEKFSEMGGCPPESKKSENNWQDWTEMSGPGMGRQLCVVNNLFIETVNNCL